MQGMWAMGFRGKAEDVRALCEQLLVLAQDDVYKWVLSGLESTIEAQGIQTAPAGEMVTFRLECNCSGALLGVQEIFQHFVELAPKLESAYQEHSIQEETYRKILYSKEGDSKTVFTDAEFTHNGIQIIAMGAEELEGDPESEAAVMEWYEEDAIPRTEEEFQTAALLMDMRHGSQIPGKFVWHGREYHYGDGEFTDDGVFVVWTQRMKDDHWIPLDDNAQKAMELVNLAV